jgi:hypothetical protein
VAGTQEASEISGSLVRERLAALGCGPFTDAPAR